MPIPVQCPACDQKLSAPDAAAGRTLTCPKCKEAVAIPLEATVRIVPLPESRPPRPSLFSRLPVLLSLILAVLILNTLLAVTATFQATRSWEYLITAVYDTDFEKRMNELGQDNWELVTARRVVDRFVPTYEMIFKRRH